MSSPAAGRRPLVLRLAAVSPLVVIAGYAVTAGCVGGANAPEAPPASASVSADASALQAELEIVDDFALLDQAGEYHALYDDADERAVVLVSFASDCPVLRSRLERVEELAQAYAERGVRFYYVDAGRHDDRAALAAEVRDSRISVPILQDEAQLVLSALHVRRTAEAILLDTRDWHIAYRGVIDDPAAESLAVAPAEDLARAPVESPTPAPVESLARAPVPYLAQAPVPYLAQAPVPYLAQAPVPYLAQALDALLEGREIDVPHTEADGSEISYAHGDDTVPSYSATVAPILARRCVPCHSEGGIAPWAMDSFAKVEDWSPMIREVVRTRRMPPWHADPHIGVFENDRSLCVDEASALVRWIEAGAPRGDGADPLSGASTLRPEWPLGEPDLVVETKRIDIPASGLVPYVFDTVELDVTEEVWVRATDVRPGNPKILHHAQLYIRYPKALKDEQPEFKGRNVFAWYRPGSASNEYPPGTGKRIPAGSKIVFELHYTTTGKVESDTTKLALYLLKKPPPLEFDTIAVVPEDLRIPAFEGHHVVTAKRRIQGDSLLYAMGPHMHYRGKSVSYRALYPDGTEETLLSVPRYDFSWQTNYRLAQPKLLPAGTSIVCNVVYDNSAHNPLNPDPSREVEWGRQTTDEMFIGALDFHLVPAPTPSPVEAISGSEGNAVNDSE